MKQKLIDISIEEIIANELLQQNDWIELSKTIKLNLELIMEFKNKLNWIAISSNISLTDELMDKLPEEFINKLNWNRISRVRKMTPYFIDKYKHRINWEDFYDKNHLPDGYELVF